MSTSGGSSAPSGAAGGDLAGTYPNPTTAKLKTSPLGTMTGASSNQAVAWNGSAWAPGSALATGTAGGDLSGTLPNPTVAQINGTALGTLTGAASTNVLAWNGSAWAPAAVSGAGHLYLARVANFSTAPSYSNSTAGSFTEFATLGSSPPGTGSYDLQVTAIAGDLVLLMPSFLGGMGGSGQCQFDFKTVAGGNFVSAVSGGGLPQWDISTTTTVPIGVPFVYPVVSGDLSAGSVKFRLVSKVTSANPVQIFGGSGYASALYALNLTALTTGT